MIPSRLDIRVGKVISVEKVWRREHPSHVVVTFGVCLEGLPPFCATPFPSLLSLAAPRC